MLYSVKRLQLLRCSTASLIVLAHVFLAFGGELLVNDNRGLLWRVDATLGSDSVGKAARVGAMRVPESRQRLILNDIAMSPGGELYGIGGPSGDGLYRIDPSTAEVMEHLGALGVTSGGPLFRQHVPSLDFNNEGQLLFAAYAPFSGNELGQIQLPRTIVRPLRTIGYEAAGDLASAPNSQLLYMSSCKPSGFLVECGDTNWLVEVDPTVDRSEQAGRRYRNTIGFDNVSGMDFVDGKLFGVTFEGDLITIDTETGKGTLVAKTEPRINAFGATLYADHTLTILPQVQINPLPVLDNTFSLGFGDNELTINLRIGVVGDDPGDTLRHRWKKGAEEIWNDQYEVVDGNRRYAISLDVEFTETNPDVVIQFNDTCGRPFVGTHISRMFGRIAHTELDNEFPLCLPLYDPQEATAAHEFGHLLGLYDEYPGGAIAPNNPNPLFLETGPGGGSFDEEGNFMSGSIMGSLEGSPQARHYQRFIDWLNGETGREMVLGEAPLFRPGEAGPSIVEGRVTLDCNGDSLADVADMQCVGTVEELDSLLVKLGLARGDFDGINGVVFTDFLVVSTNFNQAVDSYVLGDINLNGRVEFTDFLVLSRNFGRGGIPASVPEPTTFRFTILALVVASWYLRRHSYATYFTTEKDNRYH